MNVLLKAKKAFETIHRNDASIFAQPNVMSTLLEFWFYYVKYENCVISF